jgi:hypothetical protein
MYPFPNDWFTIVDPTKDTGKRVNFTNLGTPRNASNIPIESSDYNRNDGFSPGVTILTHVPNVDMAMTGAVPITDIERSFDTNQPIVVLNTTTMQRHLIWAEIDSNACAAWPPHPCARSRSKPCHPPGVNFDENALRSRSAT